jgi:Fur family peroxide stress response transcriptional regulator
MSDNRNCPGRADLTERMDALKERCRQAGLKVTPQRMAVFRTLIESKEHPSAETVFRQVRKTFPNISLDTVNRTLLMLNEIRAAFVVAGSGGPKRFDGNLQPHHHLKCTKCQRIIDFYHEPYDNIQVPQRVKETFNADKVTVYLEGVCEDCRKKR